MKSLLSKRAGLLVTPRASIHTTPTTACAKYLTEGELIKYLKSYPANLYKDTLKELLESLEKGYMTNYEDDIRKLAEINGIEN